MKFIHLSSNSYAFISLFIIYSSRLGPLSFVVVQSIHLFVLLLPYLSFIPLPGPLHYV